MTLFRDALEKLVPILNDRIRWDTLQAAVPGVEGNTLMLVITGENGGQYGLHVDNKAQELRLVNPTLIPKPTATCRMHHAVAWEMLAKKTTAKEVMGYLVRYQAMGLVGVESQDGKWFYHARVLAYIWELLQDAAMLEGVK